MKRASLPSKRCFVCDLSTGFFVANSRFTLRVVATVLEVRIASKGDVLYPGENETLDNDKLKVLTLDDGTSTINVLVPECVISQSQTRPGQTVECIVGLRQRGAIKNWYVKGLCTVTDPHAELLRWMELSCSSNRSFKHRYLTDQRATNGVLRLIASQVFSEGVSLEDLALVLQVPINQLQDHIVDLQLSGQIYQNQEGNYVPL